MRTEENTAEMKAKCPRLVVIDRTMLVRAIACNTDATPSEAAHIVNTVLYKQYAGNPDDAHDIHGGMYADRCEDNLALCEALRAAFALAGEDKQVEKIINDAIQEHGL